MNAAERKARAEGYVYHGAMVREYEKEKILPRFDELKAECQKYDSKAKLILCVEENNFRGAKTRSAFWCVFIKYSDLHKDHMKMMKSLEAARIRYNELVKIADSLTIEEIASILKYKSDKMKGGEENVVRS